MAAAAAYSVRAAATATVVATSDLVADPASYGDGRSAGATYHGAILLILVLLLLLAMLLLLMLMVVLVIPMW